MMDLAPFPCCSENQESCFIVFRDYKRKNPKGYYAYSMIMQKWTKAKYCPFCKADIEKMKALV
jgi:hypothetical protein